MTNRKRSLAHIFGKAGLLQLLTFSKHVQYGALAWGPYTHAGFGSLYYDSDDTVAVESVEEAVFVTANAFPDAFKYARPWMHSLEYAAFQVELAALWNQSTGTTVVSGLSWNNSFDFIEKDAVKAFSFAYLLHLLEDYVGHHANGYLNPQKDHPLEFEVDTLFYTLHKSDSAPWYYKRKGMAIIERNTAVKRQIISFVAETTNRFAELTMPSRSNFKGTRSQRGGMSEEDVEFHIKRFLTLITVEKIGMVANSKTYQHNMVRYDVCHAKNFQEANKTLQKAIRLTRGCLDALHRSLFPYEVDPNNATVTQLFNGKVLEASRKAYAWVDETFDKNGGTLCSIPSQAPKSTRFFRGTASTEHY